MFLIASASRIVGNIQHKAKMLSVWKTAFTFIILFGSLAGCAGLTPSLGKPSVNLISIKMGPNEGLEQRFIVGLRITNPNRVALPIHGMSYSLALEGFDLAKGVTNKIDSIPAYGEAKVDVEVGVSLLNSVRLLQRLMSHQGNELQYQLDATLDVGNRFMPRMIISESGKVPFVTPVTAQ